MNHDLLIYRIADILLLYVPFVAIVINIVYFTSSKKTRYSAVMVSLFLLIMILDTLTSKLAAFYVDLLLGLIWLYVYIGNKKLEACSK